MKRLVLILLCLVVFALPASAADKIEVVVDGELLKAEAEAEIVNGRTFVPLRAIAEKLGADVAWDQNEQRVTLKKDELETSLVIGSLSAEVNENGRESQVTLDAAPFIENGSTFVPLRFIAQGLGGRAVWCEDIRAAVIIKAHDRADGEWAELLEQYLNVELPSAIRVDNAALARDISENPNSVIGYFSNLWVDNVLEYLNENASASELNEFRSASSVDKKFNILSRIAKEHNVPLECPIKLCAVENNGNCAIILDAPASRTATLITQYILQNVNGTLVANPLQ